MADKTQAEQSAADRRKELLSEALDRAAKEGGVLLNADGKTAPKLYQRRTPVSPFNALTLALHSDRGGYGTNLYTPFPEAKKRGESVQTGEKGVPFVWYRWDTYRSRSDPNRTITKEDYGKLSTEEKKAYSPVRQKEIRTLFNIEQTTLPVADRTAYEKALKEDGTMERRGLSGPEDKATRINVNMLLHKVAEAMVTIRKDGTGVAHYDPAKNIVHLPAQKNYPGYPDYVQEALRQIVTATGHPGRLGRPGTATDGGYTPTEEQSARERLVVELASAVKMNELGLPAKLSPQSIPLVEGWKQSLKGNPRFLDGLEADVNNAVGMITKAERGTKIEMRTVPEAVRNVDQGETVNAKISMIQDDDGKWALYLKPEGEKGFAVYPEKDDVGRFFAMARRAGEQNVSFRRQLAQKYYTLATEHPEMKADIFSTKEKDIDLSAISRVSIVQTKEDQAKGQPRKILICPEVKDMGRLEPREVSPAQWQRMWLTEDKEAFKRNLAATVFADVLRRQQKQSEAEKQEDSKRMESPEQKAREEREEKAKEALTRAETGAVVGVIAGAVTKQQEQEEIGRGFHR